MGHYMVAQVAYNQLNEVERQKVDALAAGNGLFGFGPNFVESAVWSDDLKTMSFNALDAWHYINTPFVVGSVAPPSCPSPVNLPWALSQMLSSFRSLSATSGSRAFSLRMLIHLVGDAVQPMHAITLFSNDFPDGDLGGNRFSVFFRGQSTNLHSVFDSGAFRLNSSMSEPLTPQQQYAISSLVDHLTSTLYPRHSFSDKEIQFDPKSWMQQSFNNGVQYAYLNGTLAPNSELSEEYMENVYNLMLKMICLGGYRLASVLQRYLPDIPTPEPKSTLSTTALTAVVGVFSGIGGILIGAAGLWLFKKRRKRIRYLSSIENDDDMLIL